MKRPKISGVYAIEGPNGIYVGEAGDCWTRQTLNLAVKLGLECGIVREMPGAHRLERTIAEGEVKALFEARGLTVVSFAARPGDRGIRMENRFARSWQEMHPVH